MAVIFCDLSDNAARIACGNDTVRDIFCDHAACTDDRIAADMDSREYDAVAADPHIIADGNADAVFVHCVACRRMYRMSCSKNGNIGRKHDVAANGYFGHVKDCAVIVGAEIVADFNICAVIAVKRRIDEQIFAGAA